jgi:thiamine biosynthesis protein ThiS
MSATVSIRVNGEPREVPVGLTVATLLAHLGISRDRVGVERNQRLVRRAEHETTPVEAGDKFEIVSFVGGG